MAKLTLTDLVSLQNETSVVSAINNNNAAIEAALENTLSRDGTSPNEMEADLDMNTNDILNLPLPTDPTSPVRLQEYEELSDQVDQVISEVQQYVDEAEGARDAAVIAQVAAETAQGLSEAAQLAAESAQNEAEQSELAAAQSASEAEASAIQAALNSENPAVGYEFNDDTTDTDPGNGFLKFDNANPASATELYIDNQDRDGNTQTGWIDSFDDSTSPNKGILVVRQVGSPDAFASYRVSGSVVDGTGYRKIPVTALSNGGTFTDGGVLAVMFGPTGDAGAGDISGPGASTNNNIATWDGSSGTSIKDSGVAIGDVLTTSSDYLDSADIGTTVQPYDATIVVAADIGVTVQAYDADILFGDVEDQTLTGGAHVTSKDLGVITTGTVTPDPGDRPKQKYVNGGLHTLAPSTNYGNYSLDIVNNSSAGSITTSGWTQVKGDSFTTTNGHKFKCSADISDEGSLLIVVAMQ